MMGQWKSKPTPHSHDMLKPKKLEADGALPGWVWTCSCSLDFELASYRTGADAQATWLELPSRRPFTVKYKDDAAPSKT